MASTTLKWSPKKMEVENSSDTLLACRICLATDAKLFNILEWGLEQVFVDLMGTTWSAWDGFPQHVCVFCRALLLRGRELRARCRRAEQLLTQALMQQDYITTSFIKSIDRSSHQLTHSFTHNCKNEQYSNRHVYNVNHDDRWTDTQKPNHRWEVIDKVEDNIEIEINDLDEDSDIKLDTDLEKIQDDLKDSVTPKDTPKVNTVESGNETVNIGKPSLKRKKEARNKNKTEKKQPAPRKKKTGQPSSSNHNHPRFIPFNNQEHYKEFEDKFKFKIIALSDEEMLKELEARKERESYKTAAFKCELCFKGFFASKTCDNHMKIHDPARRHCCGLCGSRFFTPASLRRHTQNAHQLKFICQQCGAHISGKMNAQMHAAFHAGATFKCDHCDMQFKKITSRSTHMRLVHPSEIAAGGGGTCEQCGETFLSSMGLQRHMLRSHETLPSDPNLRCRTCKLRFESQAAIDWHRDAQPGGKCDDKHSSCVRCGEVCASEQDLLTHRMQQHGLQLFTCDMCSKSFDSKDSVQTHILRVHPMKPHKPRARWPKLGNDNACEHCGKIFKCFAHLRNHLSTHSEDRPYKCTLCPKTYKTLQGLKCHEPFHTGARKWRCTECDATFMHQSSLGLHRQTIHSGEKAKVYQCHICAKTFTRSDSLKAHIKYVHMKLTPPPRKRSKKTSA